MESFDRWVTNIWGRISKLGLPDIAVILSIVGYSSIFSYLSILKSDAYQSYAWDLGIFNQSMWTTTHNGRFFFSTVEQYTIPSGSFFGTHFSPIIFLILPIYALLPSPDTLLVIQSCILALAALPLYLLAKRELLSDSMGAMVACSYLAYPFVQGINWFDFHVESFLPLLLGFSIYYLRREDWRKFFLFVLLSLSVIEQTAVVVAVMGIYLFYSWRQEISALFTRKVPFQIKPAVPIILIALAASWYYLQQLKSVVFPVNPQQISIFDASAHWAVLGLTGNPIYLPLYILQHPTLLVKAMEYDGVLKAAFVLFLFAPLLFLPIRNSFALITASWLLPSLLSNYPSYYSIGDQYVAFIIPFIFAALVFRLRSLDKSRPRRITLRRICTMTLILSLTFSIIIGPYSPFSHSTAQVIPVPSFSSSVLEQNNHTAALDKIVAFIPPEASILTQNNIFVHVSSRINAYAIPFDNSTFSSGAAFVQYINVLLNESTFVLLDVHPGYSTPSSSYVLLSVGNRTDFGLKANTDDIHLFEKGFNAEPVSYLSGRHKGTSTRAFVLTGLIQDHGEPDSQNRDWITITRWLASQQLPSDGLMSIWTNLMEANRLEY